MGNKTNPRQEVMNKLVMNHARRLDAMFPGYFGGSSQTKHDYAKDFGWPQHVGFNDFYKMYRRNGMAKAAVMKTVRKTWEDNPRLVNDDSNGQNTAEKAIAKRFRKLRVWQKLAEADRRSLVGGYSALILRFADGLEFNQPVGDNMAGPASLAGIIVAWAPQLRVSSWDHDTLSDTYGEPLMYSFNETDLIENDTINSIPKARSFNVHPDRVIIWSSDGTVHGTSLLEAGFNDILDMEKIKGAGGEGFWKNAKAAPVLEVDKDASLREMAAMMGVEEDGMLEAMNDQVESYSKGFDNLLMLQGIQAKPMNVQLSIPESFFAVALMSYSASTEVPLKILVGSQTGERASTEDAREWAQTMNARRSDMVRPLLDEFVDRLMEFGVLVGEWEISWTDLTKATLQDKLELAAKMANINSKSDTLKTGEKVFSNGEIRQAVDYQEEPKVGTLQALPAPEKPEEDAPPTNEDVVPAKPPSLTAVR